MNRKILTTANGNVLQITLSPFEGLILLKLAAHGNIPSLVSAINQEKGAYHTDSSAVGTVVRNFYNLLEK